MKYYWQEEFESIGGEIKNGAVWLYHATTRDKAESILREGVLKAPVGAPDSYGVYLSSSESVANDYGDGTLVRVLVRAFDLNPDDVFPGRRMDFYVKTREGIYRPLKIEVGKNVKASVDFTPEELDQGIKDIMPRLESIIDALSKRNEDIDFIGFTWPRIGRDFFEVSSLIKYIAPLIIKYVPLSIGMKKDLEATLRGQWRTIRGRTTEDRLKNMQNKVEKLYSTLVFARSNYKKEYNRLLDRNFEITIDKMVIKNEGGFDDKRVSNIINILEKVIELMKSAGLSDLCYGNVNIIGNIGKSKSVAWFSRAKNEIYIRADIQDKFDNIKTLIHELGHRLFDYGSLDKVYYKNLYNKLKGDIRLPKEGDIFRLNKNQDIEVVRYYFRTVSVIVHDKKRGDFKKELRKDTFDKFLVGVGGGDFVTSYAAKNYEENFCEMFSFFVLGKLSEEKEELFIKGIL